MVGKRLTTKKKLAYCYSKKDSQLTILDVSDPTLPLILGTLKDSVNLRDISIIVIQDDNEN